MTTREEFRKSVRELIELISSREQQFEYQENVPIANVASELLCMWFDDLYHPETDLFQNSFESKELEILEAFNQFYDSRTNKLPDTLEELHRAKEWNQIVSEAKRVLNDISW